MASERRPTKLSQRRREGGVYLFAVSNFYFEMEPEISAKKLIHDLEGITLAKNTAVRKRKTSLFEAKERPKPRDEDCGIAVMTHADYPLRSRSRSLPVDPEKVKIPSGFVKENISKMIQEVLESKLTGKKYVASECSKITRELVNILRDRVVELDMKKYKFICTCYITQKLKPAPAVQSGCAWDEDAIGIDRDGFAEYIYKNDDLIAVATVYGVYVQKMSEREKYIKGIRESIHSPIPE